MSSFHSILGSFGGASLLLPPRKDLEGSFGYLLAREGVYAPGGHVFLAHTKHKVNNIVGLSALRLAFFMGFELHKVVQWFLY